MRSAVERDIPHDQLESAIGNRLQLGWTIKQLVPCSTQTRHLQDGFATFVTHWTIVLVRQEEKD